MPQPTCSDLICNLPYVAQELQLLAGSMSDGDARNGIELASAWCDVC